TAGFSINGGGQLLTITSGNVTRQTIAAGSHALACSIILGANGIWDIGGSGSLSVSGAISGAASFAKRGAGTLVLSGPNSYAGTTNIEAGVLSVSIVSVSGGVSNLGNSSAAIGLGTASTNGTLKYTGPTDTMTRGITLGTAGGTLDIS